MYIIPSCHKDNKEYQQKLFTYFLLSSLNNRRLDIQGTFVGLVINPVNSTVENFTGQISGSITGNIINATVNNIQNTPATITGTATIKGSLQSPVLEINLNTTFFTLPTTITGSVNLSSINIPKNSNNIISSTSGFAKLKIELGTDFTIEARRISFSLILLLNF